MATQTKKRLKKKVATKATKVAKKDRKPSIAIVLVEELGKAKVGTDDVLKKVVKQKNGRDLNSKNLSWYKSQFRKGLLIGMKPGTHKINQK